MSDTLEIVIRVMPGGESVDVELSRYSTGQEILMGLLDGGVAPREAQTGEPLSYELISKANNIRIESHKTLHDLGIRNGDTILLVPELTPGAAPLLSGLYRRGDE